MKRYKQAVFAISLLFSVGAHALDEQQIRSQLVMLNNSGQLDDQGLRLADTEELVPVLSADPEVVSANYLTSKLVGDAVGRYILGPQESADQLRPVVGALRDAVLTRSSPEAAAALAIQLLPSLQNDGRCSGTPGSESGMSCAFYFIGGDPSPSAPSVGMIVDKKLIEPMSTTSESSDLLSTTQLSNGIQSAIKKGTKTGVSSGSFDTSFNGVAVHVPYVIAYYVLYKCNANCEFWGEAFGGIDLQYLTTNSDQVLAHIPFGYHLSVSRSINLAFDYIQSELGLKKLNNDEMIRYIQRHADLRYYRLHHNTTIGQYLEAACGVSYYPYQSSPAYQATQGGIPASSQTYGFSLRYGTSYQGSPDATAVATSPGNFPVPSASLFVPSTPTTIGGIAIPPSANVGSKNGAMYYLSQVWSFSPNTIFAAMQSANMEGAACSATRTFTGYYGLSFSLKGDTFFSFLGAPGSTNNFNNYDLPDVLFAAAFYSGHIPETVNTTTLQ